MIPEIINFKLTSRCNHDCSYCYASRSDKELGLEELGGIFTRAKSWGTKGIVLCGGEPTLRREFDKAVRMVNEMGFRLFLAYFWNY